MKRLAVLLIASITLTSLGAHAASPQVAQLFGCNFLEGKGMADLEKALDAYKAAVPKIKSPELQKMGSNLWLPYRATTPYDFVWSDRNMTLEEWGKLSVAYDSSKEGQAADAVFSGVAKCSAAGLVTSEILFQTKQALQDDDDLLLESYGCTLKPGKTMADVDAALAVWKPVFAKAATGASTVLRRIPLLPGQYDLMYLAVWDDPAAYAKATSAFMADPGSSASDAALNAVEQCTGGLWKSRSIVRPPQP